MYCFLGLAPEITQYDTRVPRADESVYASEGAQFSLVRPETLESLFVMQRLTKDPKLVASSLHVPM